MKRIYIIILVAVLAVGGVAGIVVGFDAGSKYDQSTPVATAKSFIEAMLKGDKEAFGTLTQDVIPWEIMVSDLLSYSTTNMSGYNIKDYSYYQQGTVVLVYNHTLTPSPENLDYFCMNIAMAEDGYCIVNLVLPGYYRSTWPVNFNTICNEAVQHKGTKF